MISLKIYPAVVATPKFYCGRKPSKMIIVRRGIAI